MKDERQSSSLQKMMQRHHAHPEYELALVPFSVKLKSIKKMQRGDILLLGIAQLELVLVKESTVLATAHVVSQGKTMKLEIDSTQENAVYSNHSKKYETLLCSFGKIQSRLLEEGHKIEIPLLESDAVQLFLKEKKLGSAKLVNVEEEIALEITEVKHG